MGPPAWTTFSPTAHRLVSVLRGFGRRTDHSGGFGLSLLYYSLQGISYSDLVLIHVIRDMISDHMDARYSISEKYLWTLRAIERDRLLFPFSHLILRATVPFLSLF